MVSSTAATVAAYLSSLPEDRRHTIAAVRETIMSNLPKGYSEGMQLGMIAYFIPLSRHNDTYNGKPLVYAALAAQKHHMAVYLMGVYADPSLRGWFESAYKNSGKRMDIGKCCVRFRALDDLPLEVIGRAVAAIPPDRFIALSETSRARAKSKGPVRKRSNVSPLRRAIDSDRAEYRRHRPRSR